MNQDQQQNTETNLHRQAVLELSDMYYKISYACYIIRKQWQAWKYLQQIDYKEQCRKFEKEPSETSRNKKKKN